MDGSFFPLIDSFLTMLFVEPLFLFIFLPVCLAFFFATPRKYRVYSLIAASAVFYCYWSVGFFLLLMASITFNFMVGRYLRREKELYLLVFGISANLLNIAYFKYANFFMEVVSDLGNTNTIVMDIVLPLGISFYTFQQITYLIDQYRDSNNDIEPTYIEFVFYVLFFPQLIAGPIVHHYQLIPQLKRKFTDLYFASGCLLFLIGFSKKILVADTLSPVVSSVFDGNPSLNIVESILGTLSYTMQLYYDFSGYADMALGLGLMFGIRLPINFFSPYKSLSIQDFWRRWHVTLSAFLRDYIYIPLGGNRFGNIRKYRNLLITFLLGGLWHGAGYNFLIWGGIHGIALIAHAAWYQATNDYIKLPKLVSFSLTMLVVMFGWIWFRADTVDSALNVLSGFGVLPNIVALQKAKLMELHTILIPNITMSLSTLGILVAAIISSVSFHNSMEIIHSKRLQLLYAPAILLCFLLSLSYFGEPSEFIYFAF